MSYFAPYIDASGLHLPTYEDRLMDLCDAYRGIFGIEAELSASVPDYQLLSVFAKALDDVSSLTLQAYNSRSPQYASGSALDLLLPQYGLFRAAGETDASARARIRNALASRGYGSYDALLASVRAVTGVMDAKLYVNDTGTTDSVGVPAHSVSVVVDGGNSGALAQAIFDKKAPGIGTWGSSSGTASDGEGNTHTVFFERSMPAMAFIYIFIRKLSGCDENAVRDAVVPAVRNHINALGIAAPLNVPRLYSVIYGADPKLSGSFVVTDIQAAVPGAASVERELVPCDWNKSLWVQSDVSITITFST